jgi:hypothetical protein
MTQISPRIKNKRAEQKVGENARDKSTSTRDNEEGSQTILTEVFLLEVGEGGCVFS